VLRLSTPAPYVAAPSLPHDRGTRRPSEQVVDFDAVRAVRVLWNGCLVRRPSSVHDDVPMKTEKLT